MQGNEQISLVRRIELLKLLDESVQECISCGLCNSRIKTVFGMGNPEAGLMFVGEGPGADEDKQGLPFVGAAGVILTKMIKALGFTRRDVYIANVVKCRPPNNRTPEPDEIKACRNFLYSQIEIIKPKVICTLGAIASNLLIGVKEKISSIRGGVFRYNDILVIPTYHPAYLYRTYSKKREVWDDLLLVEMLLKESADIRLPDFSIENVFISNFEKVKEREINYGAYNKLF